MVRSQKKGPVIGWRLWRYIFRRATPLLAVAAVPTLAASPWSAGAQETTFYKDVRPILRTHCAICHSDSTVDDLDTSGGVSLSSLDAMIKGSKVSVVTPGRPSASPLFNRLVHPDPEKRMPKDADALDLTKIEVIRKWIELGCPVGQPVAPTGRIERRQRRFRELELPIAATAPPGFAEKGKAGRLALVGRIGPLAAVTAVAFHPNGNHLACASFRRIVVWDLSKAVVIREMTELTGAVLALQFSPDGKWLWCAGGDPGVGGELKSFRSGDWKLEQQFTNSDDVFSGVALSPDGTHLAIVGYDRFLRVFALPNLTLKFSVKAHSDFANAVAFSKDGNQIATGGKDNSVKLWSLKTGTCAHAFSGHNQEVLAVLFAPNGKSLYSTGREPPIRKWEIEKGGRSTTQNAHGGIVCSLSWNALWSRFISGGADQVVRIWRPDATVEKSLSGATDMVYSVALSPDGRLAAAGTWDGFIRLWDVAAGRQVATLLSAERDDGKPCDWLVTTPTGYYAASSTLAGRSRWTISGQELPYTLVAQVLERPNEVANSLAGRTTTPVLFPIAKRESKTAPTKKATIATTQASRSKAQEKPTPPAKSPATSAKPTAKASGASKPD